jgi:hypothetical protein
MAGEPRDGRKPLGSFLQKQTKNLSVGSVPHRPHRPSGIVAVRLWRDLPGAVSDKFGIIWILTQ